MFKSVAIQLCKFQTSDKRVSMVHDVHDPTKQGLTVRKERAQDRRTAF